MKRRKKLDATTLSLEQRRHETIRLYREEKMTMAAIAKLLGISLSTVSLDIRNAIDEIIEEQKVYARELHKQMVDDAMMTRQELWAIMTGRYDVQTRLKAFDAFRKNNEHLAKLVGANAPQRLDINLRELSDEELERLINDYHGGE